MLIFTATDSENLPRSGSSLLSMELAPPAFHISPSISLVGIYVVDDAVLDFLYINVRSETEDIGVPGRQESSCEGG